MSQVQTKLPRSMASKLHWYHWFVVLASLILTLSAWYMTSKLGEQKAQLQFDFQAKQIVELVKERMKKYEDALWSGTAMLHALPAEVTAKEWNQFATALSIKDKYPGINGIGVIDYVRPEAMAQYLARHRQVRPDYKVHPAHDKNEYWPITHIEPVDSNRKAVGLDMAHETNRHSAAMKARDTGKAQITGPIVLVQDAKKTPGFLFFVPYYQSITQPDSVGQRQEEFTAIVYAPFIMANLMQGTLLNKNRLVNFSINDADDLLYDELQSDVENDLAATPFTKITTIEMYGRAWTFKLQSSPLFLQQITNTQPLMILIGGLFIDAMLLTLFIVLARSNKKAVEFANIATKELRQSQQSLQTTINSMNDGLLTIDSQNTILSYNTTAEKIFGFNKQDIVDNPITVLPSDPQQMTHFLDVINYDNDECTKRVNIVNNQGKVIPTEITFTKAEHTSNDYYIAVIRDLSGKVKADKALADSKALLNTAVDASSAGFAICDKQGNFVQINQALCRWLGFGKDELLYQSMMGIIPEKDGIDMASLMTELLDGKQASVQAEKQYLRKNGDLIWGLLTAASVKDVDQQITHIVLHIIDIEKEKELRNDLLRQNKALEKSNADLEQFAYIASHDLKSPLNAIQQLASWINEDCHERLPDESKEHLNLMLSRSKRMVRLLDDLLNYSRVGRYNYKNEPISLKELVIDQFNLIDKPAAFKCEAPDIQLLVPRIPFEMVIRNMMSNAIKHHDKEYGHISFSYCQNNHEQVITISDDGPGIPENMHEKIFEMFQTLKSRDEVEGSGMGLAMVKRIVHHYHGQIKIITNEERGSSFEIHWPIDNPLKQQEQQALAMHTEK